MTGLVRLNWRRGIEQVALPKRGGAEMEQHASLLAVGI